MALQHLSAEEARQAQPQQSPISAPEPWLGPDSVESGPWTRRELFGYMLWGGIALVILVFECVAAFDGDRTPWPTLSSTAGNLQEDHHWTGLLILGGLSVLAARIVFYPWPNRRSEG
jgi:magnesium-transporting ATPase (P-type)